MFSSTYRQKKTYTQYIGMEIETGKLVFRMEKWFWMAQCETIGLLFALGKIKIKNLKQTNKKIGQTLKFFGAYLQTREETEGYWAKI